MRNVTYFNPIHAEENTPLVTIFETNVEKKQSVALDSRGARYVIELSKASFGGVYYPVVGTQWLLKKVSGIWTLMARSTQQNPQLDPAFNPVPGETYIGGESKTIVVGDLQVNGTFIGGVTSLDDLSDVVLTAPANNEVLKYNGTNWVNATVAAGSLALDDLSDVAISSVANRNVLVYESATSLWKNRKDILLEQASAATAAISSRVAADTQERFIVGADGKLNWGPGNATQDTNLYRQASAVLQMDGALRANTAGSGSLAFASIVSGDSQNRWVSTAAGLMEWGSGSASRDTNLFRSAADLLGTDDSLLFTDKTKQIIFGSSGTSTANIAIERASVNDFLLTSFITGDTQRRFRLTSEGILQWGSGSATVDTNLYRSAADTLKTDDSLVVGAAATIGTGATITSGGLTITAGGLTVTAGGATVAAGDITATTGNVKVTDGTKQVNVGASGSAASFAAKVAATTTDVLTSRVTTDAVDRFTVNGDGKLEWSDGTNAIDTNLYRQAASVLQIDGALRTAPAGGGSVAFASMATGDTQNRWVSTAGGLMEWGSGSAARDTNLYRSAADTLKTDDSFVVGAAATIGTGLTVTAGGATVTAGNATVTAGNVNLTDGTKQVNIGASGSTASFAVKAAATTTDVFSSRVTTDTVDRHTINGDGKLEWSDGTNAIDTNLYRSAASTLTTDGHFVMSDKTKQFVIGTSGGSTASIAIERGASSDFIMTSFVTSDTQRRFRVLADGKIDWGSGSVTADTNLYRSAADTLKTDDSLVVGAAATIGTGLTVTAGGATVTAGNVVITAGDLTMSTSTANFTMGGKIHGRGFIGANTATASAGSWPVQSTGAEVAVPAANWNTEPTYAFLDGRLYHVQIRYALISNAVDDRVVIRVRKGSATTSGTQLGVFGQGNNASSTNSGYCWFYIKNVSGSTVSTKLSLTIVGVAAGSSFNPSTDQQLVVAVEDIGATSDQTDLATIAFAIT